MGGKTVVCSETASRISVESERNEVLIFGKCCHFINSVGIFSAILAISLTLSILLLSSIFKPIPEPIYLLEISTEKSMPLETNRKFLSVALGANLIAEGLNKFDMTNPQLHKLMSALSPGYLRIGGTMADRLWFVPNGNFKFKSSFPTEIDGGECSYDGINCEERIRNNFTMSGEEWLNLNKIASDTGLTVLFDVNCLLRSYDGAWNSNNAEELVDFSNSHNLRIIWELGNEPTSYNKEFHYEVNATQLGYDFLKLREILNRYPRYQDALLVGPDTKKPRPNNHKSSEYLQRFLVNGGDYINAITWHQYYLNGKMATYSDFLNPKIFDDLKSQISIIRDAVSAARYYSKPIWLGETSSAYGGGAPGYSDRFIASFMWLDKLGVAAKYGLHLVIRQTLYKGHYALIGDDLTPNPDWWVSILYKHLVGNKVVFCNSTSSDLIRLYCHCTENQVTNASYPTVTVFGMNLKNSEVKIQLEGILPTRDSRLSPDILAYVVTTTDLLSKAVILNGEALNLLPNGDLPKLEPKVVKSKPYLSLPPYSLVFWIIPSPNFSLCVFNDK